MTLRALICAAALASVPLAGSADEIALPTGGARTAEFFAPSGNFAMPNGPWRDGVIPMTEARGAVLREAWRYSASALTSDQILHLVATALSDAGFDIMFQCADSDCGGYDFRFGWQVIDEPEMHIDLGDFRYLYGEKPGPDGPEFVNVLVSRSPSSAYLQIVRVAPGDGARPRGAVAEPPPPDTPAVTPEAPVAAPGSLAKTLVTTGHAVLDDVVFPTGSSDLGNGDFSSLSALAAFLTDHPDAQLVLVGHTDDEGTLEANIALSKRRAASVMRALIETHDIAAGRLSAEGVGYLSPISANSSEAGRRVNRRVEAVLISSR